MLNKFTFPVISPEKPYTSQVAPCIGFPKQFETLRQALRAPCLAQNDLTRAICTGKAFTTVVESREAGSYREGAPAGRGESPQKQNKHSKRRPKTLRRHQIERKHYRADRQARSRTKQPRAICPGRLRSKRVECREAGVLPRRRYPCGAGQSPRNKINTQNAAPRRYTATRLKGSITGPADRREAERNNPGLSARGVCAAGEWSAAKRGSKCLRAGTEPENQNKHSKRRPPRRYTATKIERKHTRADRQARSKRNNPGLSARGVCAANEWSARRSGVPTVPYGAGQSPRNKINTQNAAPDATPPPD